MAKRKVLIAGDSFFSPNKSNTAWHNLLRKEAKVNNLACNGVGQYKILKQISQTNLKKYDFVIVGITSPNRVHTESNPWYDLYHATHKHADFLYEDVKSKTDCLEKENILWYFENVFDIEYYNMIHNLLVNEIHTIIHNVPHQMYTFFNLHLPGVINLNNIWQENKGTVNHMSARGHEKTYDIISARL